MAKYNFKVAKPYISDPAKVVVRGWVQVDDWWFSIEPVWDPVEDLWAKLTYAGALAVAKRFKGEMAAFKDIDRLHADAVKGLALELPVYNLPDQSQLRAAHVPSDPKADAKEKEDELKAFLVANMGGLEWAHYHDAKVQKQLDDAGWKPDGQKRLANCGKHWIAGASAKKAMLKGWWNGKKFIQEGTRRDTHDDQHHDYATTTIIKVKSDEMPPIKR
jgi:hypothetical protein